jgi:hypothetical protein
MRQELTVHYVASQNPQSPYVWDHDSWEAYRKVWSPGQVPSSKISFKAGEQAGQQSQ